MIEKDWITKAGYRALCVITMGSWRCGYVGIPATHQWFEKDYDTPDVRVHGGLTFANSLSALAIETQDREKLWFFGFDCAHLNDGYIPGGEMDRLPFTPRNPGIVRTLEYVEKECEELAEQLKAKESQ